MWRSLAFVTVAAGALFALRAAVIVPWQCNVVAAEISESTDRAWNDAGTESARAAATAHLPRLRACLANRPTDVRLAMLAANNYALLNRYAVAARELEGALRHEPRPELYFELAQMQLQMGARADALANFVRAGVFAGTDRFTEIADPEVRRKAYVAVGRHEEALLVRQHRFDARDRLAGLAGVPVAGAALRNEVDTIHVVAPRPDSGVRFEWRSADVVPHARTTAWVFVTRGRVYLGSGNGSEANRSVYSTTTGRWEKLEAVNETCPSSVTILAAADAGGADFVVRDVQARATLAAPPCEP